MRNMVTAALAALFVAAACSGTSGGTSTVPTTGPAATQPTPVTATAPPATPTTAPGGPEVDQGAAAMVSSIAVGLGEEDVFGPDTVTFGAGSVWVAVLAEDGSRSRVVRIDAVTGDVLASIPLPDPGSAAFGAGALWVADVGSGGTYRVDPATGVVTKSPAGGDIVAAGEGGVWVVDGEDVLTQLDPADGSAVRTIDVIDRTVVEESLPLAVIGTDFEGLDELPFTVDAFGSMALGFGWLWATVDATDGIVARVDTATGVVTDVMLLPGLSAVADLAGTYAMAPSGGHMWVLVDFTDGSGGLLGINPETFTVDVSALLPLDEDAAVWQLAATEDRLYVIDDSETLFVVDSLTQDLVTTVKLGTEFIQDVAVGDGAVWITDLDQSRVVVVR